MTGAGDLLAEERSQNALTIKAEPGPIPDDKDWSLIEGHTVPSSRRPTRGGRRAGAQEDVQQMNAIARAGPTERFRLPFNYPPLAPSPLYPNRELLDPPLSQTQAHSGSYITAVITPFGVTPIRSQSDFESLLRRQQRARSLEEPAMLVGIPFGLDPAREKDRTTWVDGAGISSPDGLAVFDLRRIDLEPLEPFKP